MQPRLYIHSISTVKRAKKNKRKSAGKVHRGIPEIARWYCSIYSYEARQRSIALQNYIRVKSKKSLYLGRVKIPFLNSNHFPSFSLSLSLSLSL